MYYLVFLVSCNIVILVECDEKLICNRVLVYCMITFHSVPFKCVDVYVIWVSSLARSSLFVFL